MASVHPIQFGLDGVELAQPQAVELVDLGKQCVADTALLAFLLGERLQHLLRLGFTLLLGQEVIRLDGRHAGLLEFLSQLTFDLGKLFLKTLARGIELALFELKPGGNSAGLLLDLLELIDFGNEIGKFGVISREEIGVLLGDVARGITQIVFVLGDQLPEGEHKAVCPLLHACQCTGILLEAKALLQLVGNPVLFKFLQPEVGIGELGLVITPEFGSIAELEPALRSITHMLALGFDFVSQCAELFAHQLFH